MSLTEKHCKPCEGGAQPLGVAAAKAMMAQVPGWDLGTGGREILRHFKFDSYWAGVGFVNAVAWIAQQEKHHPDIELVYKGVMVRFSTHAVNGLSENDFICAARVNKLFE